MTDELEMLQDKQCYDITAVLVSYNPNIEVLRAAVRAVLNQVSAVFVIDNASSNFSPAWFDDFKDQKNLHLLPKQENLGIAAAHNIGIKQAVEKGAEFVLLLDQDSQAGADMVMQLRSAYLNLDEKGIQVAALGPQYQDADNGKLSQFIKIRRFPFVSNQNSENTSLVEADFLISSGSLIPVSALDIVGLMDESLFIDSVDTEWCFRAKSKGLKVFGVCGAVMTHTLGEQRKEVSWLFQKRMVFFHKPFRYYYMFRNSLLLYRRSYMPWSWKFADMLRCLKMAFFFSWAAENRFIFLKMMYFGIMDGLKGITGKRSDF